MKKCIAPAVVLFSTMLISGCSNEPGSMAWCEAQAEQPKSEWTMDDAGTYTAHCVLDSTTIGSEEWCEDLDENNKGDWSFNNVMDYARHCLL